MRIPRIISTAKTSLLVILVGVSMLLSENLWTGGWGTSTETPFSPETTTPQGTAPSLKQVTSPYRIVLENQSNRAISVQIPGTNDYQDWLKRLSSAHVYSMNQVPTLDESKFVRFARFDFGSSINHSQLATWIPGILASVFPQSANEVYLYQTEANGPIMLGFSSPEGTYVGQTDLSSAPMADAISHAVELEPWALLSQDLGTLIPKSDFSMFSLQVNLSNQPILPLVHSFFVNPEALTSVQEDPNTILWTDGSRAVLWDKSKSMLTYADPNAPNTSLHPMQVTDILQYVESHGGANDSSILFERNTDSADTQLSLQPYEYGFPVLGTQRSISIDIVNGRIAQYQQPISHVYIQSRNMEQIMGSNQLQSILRTLMPSTSVDTLSIQLGYLLTDVKDHTGTLRPVYAVSQSGMLLWDIDARTGSVVKGMNLS